MTTQQSLVLIKPDGIRRCIIGRIISRLEETGLKICAMKMIWADETLAKNHYRLDENWAKNVFTKTKTTSEKEGKPFPYKDYLEFGKLIQSWNMNFLREGPVVAMVIEGPHAVEIIRKLVGATEPRQALPGTIRGDFASIESYAVANAKERVIKNLIHASDSEENGKREITLWFSPKEIHSYHNIHD